MHSHNHPSRTSSVKCYFCASQLDNVAPDVKYPMCSYCSNSNSKSVLLRICMLNPSIDPIALANRCMLHPSIPIHGPQHHYLTACVVLGWLRALGFKVEEHMFKIAIERSSIIPGGTCGTMGLCGAPIGASTALAVFLRSTPLKPRERTLSLKVASEGLRIIEEIDGVRCCKASTYASIIAASKILAEELGIGFKVEKVLCIFSDKNPDCLKSSCPFYHKS